MTALFLYGGMTLVLAMGAVVVGTVVTCQTPLSGHFSPVFAVVPMGFLKVSPLTRQGRLSPLLSTEELDHSPIKCRPRTTRGNIRMLGSLTAK